MLHKLVSWMRPKGGAPATGRLARWLGRNWAHLTYATRVEPTWLEVNRHVVPIRGLPEAFAGLRIAQMSDFHAGGRVTAAYLHEAVDLAHAEEPHVIVLTGDFIHKGFRHVEMVGRALGRLRAAHGVFAVLGNHDYSVRNALGLRRHRHLHQAVADALQVNGIRVLRNETHVLTHEGQQLYLTGVEDLWSRVCDVDAALAGLSESVPRVILAHNPCTIERLGAHRCDLMLSGHTHGGQVNLPVVGRVALGPRGRRFAAGMYRVHKSMLYVNKGIGFGLPIRYGVRPEVAVLKLTPEREKPAH